MLKLSYRSLERGTLLTRSYRANAFFIPTTFYSQVVSSANFCVGDKRGLPLTFCTTRKVTTKDHQQRHKVATAANKKASVSLIGLNDIEVPSFPSLEETTATMKEEFDLKAKKKRTVQTKRVVISSEYVESLLPNQSTRRKFRWTSDLDALLIEGVTLYKETEGWARVAEHVGHGLAWKQCAKRWNCYLSSAQQPDIKYGRWTTEENLKLEELVPQYVIQSYWSEQHKRKTKERIDWTAIGRELHRIPRSCQNRWKNLQDSTFKKGSFTAEEDALIVKGIAEWGDRKGMWVNLQREIGRPSPVLLNRWTNVLKPRILLQDENPTGSLDVARSKKLGNILRARWTKEMDNLLIEGVALYKETEGWARVAEHVGHGLAWKQCAKRWNCYLSSAQQPDIKHGGWTTEEMRMLEELVPQHVIKPHQSETLQVQSKDRIDWLAIGKVLGRLKKECRDTWKTWESKKLKKGFYTAEEDAMIAKRVGEWGDKGKGVHGLWASLQQEMGRPAPSISRRWYARTKSLKSPKSLKSLKSLKGALWR